MYQTYIHTYIHKTEIKYRDLADLNIRNLVAESRY